MPYNLWKLKMHIHQSYAVCKHVCYARPGNQNIREKLIANINHALIWLKITES